MYDLIIVGSGPAGLTASIYASRYKLANLVVGKVLGGAITLAHKVENFPGFTSISGLELAQKMGEQVKSLGAEIITDEVKKIEKIEKGFKVATQSSKEYESKTLIVATGTERKKLDIPGEEEYLGRGVSYCTTCDVAFFRDKTVALIGGSNAAVGGAVHAANFAKKVYIIYRRDQLRAEPMWVEEALANPKIEVIYKINITAITGDGAKVTGVKLDNPYQGVKILPLDGVFIEIGGVPGTELAKNLGVEVDEKEYVKVGSDMATNVPGVFAAGDIANAAGELQQIVIACSEGVIAATTAYKFLKTRNNYQRCQ